MLQRMKNVLRIAVDRPRDFLGRFSLSAGKFLLRRALHLKQASGRFLSGFNPWLMVGVDVHERSIESNRAFVERDQGADAESVRLRNANRYRLAVLFVKRCPR